MYESGDDIFLLLVDGINGIGSRMFVEKLLLYYLIIDEWRRVIVSLICGVVLKSIYFL